ncbi:unnamed protein product [Peniophora sp. CBMAI 1063]|nr:unnamed protein product [Peniophora sp. CBMAI 1063]
MSPLNHDMYLNVYGIALGSRMRKYTLSEDKRTAASPYPVVGGIADVPSEDISKGEASGYPLLDTVIVKGDVVCNHWWKAQGPANQGQYFCVGWVRNSDCRSGRDPRIDKLDCGFRFSASQFERKEPMYLNIAWDRKSTWGLHAMTQEQLDARIEYYRGSTNTNPAWGIIKSLRSAPIVVEGYTHVKTISAPEDLVAWGVSHSLMSHTALVPRLQTPPPSPEKKRKLGSAEHAGPSSLRDR